MRCIWCIYIPNSPSPYESMHWLKCVVGIIVQNFEKLFTLSAGFCTKHGKSEDIFVVFVAVIPMCACTECQALVFIWVLHILIKIFSHFNPTRHKAHTTYTGSCDCSQPPTYCADICAASKKDELAINVVFTGKRAGDEGEILITLAIVDSDGDGGVSETIASSSSTAVGADDVEIDAAVPVAGLADGTYELTISGGDVFGFRMQSKAMVDVKAAKNVGYVVTDKPIYKPG